jgi:hypothetical protein
MLCDAWIRRWRLETESRPASQAAGEEGIRSRALAEVERSRHVRFHLGAFLLGLVILGGPWVAINYMNADGWPDRLSDKGRPGDWDPTVLVVLIVWALLLAIHGLKAYSRRPVSEAEIQRTAERLKQG